MVNLLLLIGVPAAVIVIAVIVYTVLPRFGPHYTSLATGSKCGKQFDCKWLPGGSFTAVRLGKERYMRCPYATNGPLLTYGRQGYMVTTTRPILRRTESFESPLFMSRHDLRQTLTEL
jgi:hypothetical protein